MVSSLTGIANVIPGRMVASSPGAIPHFYGLEWLKTSHIDRGETRMESANDSCRSSPAKDIENYQLKLIAIETRSITYENSESHRIKQYISIIVFNSVAGRR